MFGITSAPVIDRASGRIFLEAAPEGLDPDAIERVAAQVRPDPQHADELHDVLMSLITVRPAAEWKEMFDALVAVRRAVVVRNDSVAENGAGELWAAVERLAAVETLYPGAVIEPPYRPPAALAGPADEDEAIARLLRGHLDCRGPSTVAALAAATGLRETLIARGLAVVEQEGFALSGRFTSPDADLEYCARRLLTRIHGYTRDRRRREVEPVTE